MSAERSEGAILAGRFRLDRRLGEGGMGVVWAAMNTTTRRRVAIKLLKEDRTSDPNVRRRFLREGRAASAVQHPNVVEILDVLELDDGTPAMVMELLEGESLGQRLRRVRKLPLAEVAAVLVPAIAAVGTAHAHGIVHRDLKPDNIFLSRGHEDAVVVKVLDFGIAKMTVDGDHSATEGGLTGTGAMLGTPYYMAPEQLFTDETIDYRCDIWALGIILYECLSGVRPTRGENFADIVKVIATRSLVPLDTVARDLPPEIVDFVMRMLSFEKDQRPQSLREVRDVLKHYTDVMASTFGDPVLAPVKQNLADSSGQMVGLRKSDVELLLAGEETQDAGERPRGANTTLDAPSMRLEALAALRTGPDTHHGLANTLVGARSPARRYAVLAGAALVIALAAGAYAFRASTTPQATAAVARPAAPPPTTDIPPSPPPEATVATTTTTTTTTEPAKPIAANTAPTAHTTGTTTPTTATTTVRRPTSPTTTAVTPKPERTPSSDPTATPTHRPAGGLVEKPPF